jgi:hypothetical protein
MHWLKSSVTDRKSQSHRNSKLACLRLPSHILNMLPDEAPHPLQIEIWRSIPWERRLLLIEQLHCSTNKWKASCVQLQNPNWSDERVQTDTKRRISEVDPEFLFEGVLPMLTAGGERFNREMMIEWLKDAVWK